MKHIQTNGRELILVEVPKGDRDKKDFYISEAGNLFGYAHGEPMQCDTYINLTGCVVIGLLRELKPEQVEPYVESRLSQSKTDTDFKNYHTNAFSELSEIESFRTLLEENSIDPTLNYLLIEKLK